MNAVQFTHNYKIKYTTKDEKYDSLGYWQVGNEKYSSKANALLEATRTNTGLKYHFQNNTWKNYDWSQPPKQNLQELYVERAKQLLDKYDHVALLWSGGSDSTAVLKIFIDNNLKLDEVISYGMINSAVNEKDKTNAEVFHQHDRFKTYIDNAGISFRFLNMWDRIDEVKLDDNFIDTGDLRYCFDNLIKVQAGYHTDPKLMQLAHKGKKVCVLTGLEKPRVFVENDNFYTAFIDILTSANVYPMLYGGNYNGVAFERFFLTPDLPNLYAKMVHTLIDWFEHNYIGYKDFLTYRDFFQVDKYYDIANQVLYDWKSQDNWTLGKHNSARFCQKYEPLRTSMPEFDLYQRWSDMTWEINKNINTKFVQPYGDFLPNYTKFYKIRRTTDYEKPSKAQQKLRLQQIVDKLN